MMSGSNIRVHAAADHLYSEERLIDTPDLRLALFSVPTDRLCIGALRDRLTQSLQEFGIQSNIGTTQICMAFEEALANAFYHGNLELDSALKEDGTGRFSQLAKERCGKSPWKDRQVHLLELATPIGLWVTIGDEGHGFDVAAALKRTEHPMSILASGRGLVMMKAFTDELVFNGKGNETTLVIYHRSNRDICELLQERSQVRQSGRSSHSLL